MYGHFARHLSSLYTPASAVSSGMPRFSSWVHIAVITSRLTQPWSPDAYNLPGLGFKGLGLRVQRFAWIVRKAVEVFRGFTAPSEGSYTGLRFASEDDGS